MPKVKVQAIHSEWRSSQPLPKEVRDTPLLSRLMRSSRSRYSLRIRKAWTIDTAPSSTLKVKVAFDQACDTLTESSAKKMSGMA